jgi:translocation and assembly module TamB
VRVSRDVVYAASDTLPRGSLDLYARVRMIVGDKVRVQGFGLDIKPEGSVMATDEPGLPTLGSGELTAREGTYRIYGQELAIDRGRLIFGGGPIANPGVDVRASRRTDDGTIAGFEVKGTLVQPDVKVFSDPPRGQSQALAYVMFGRPIERGNLAQGQLVSTMATTMGMGGSELLAHGLATGLGIEQVRIQAGANANATSVMLGSHLSPKLYMSYGMGLFEATPAVQLRYVIDRRWTIEAEAAQQSRVDALFTIEK